MSNTTKVILNFKDKISEAFQEDTEEFRQYQIIQLSGGDVIDVMNVCYDGASFICQKALFLAGNVIIIMTNPFFGKISAESNKKNDKDDNDNNVQDDA
tara:strand:- start:125 stop:418 length:294 start_codon:yes stop_codon:yes gene_type:complete